VNEDQKRWMNNIRNGCRESFQHMDLIWNMLTLEQKANPKFASAFHDLSGSMSLISNSHKLLELS
jgi:hypothetical protein